MAQAVLSGGKTGGGRLQNAAAAVLGNNNNYKPALTDERRNTLGGGNAGLPPSGYRGASMNNYPRAGTGNGHGGSFSDPFGSAGYGSGPYNYPSNTGAAMSGPKIATINVRVSIIE